MDSSKSGLTKMNFSIRTVTVLYTLDEHYLWCYKLMTIFPARYRCDIIKRHGDLAQSDPSTLTSKNTWIRGVFAEYSLPQVRMGTPRLRKSHVMNLPSSHSSIWQQAFNWGSDYQGCSGLDCRVTERVFNCSELLLYRLQVSGLNSYLNFSKGNES